MGRRERHGEIRGLRARARGHRPVAPAAAVPRPAETPLWFDPSLRTAAELVAERAAGREIGRPAAVAGSKPFPGRAGGLRGQDPSR